MIALDTSIVMKWFKSGERYETEAQKLRELIEKREVEAVANEITSLEVVRGLKSSQVRQPTLGIDDADIEEAYTILEEMFRTGILLECRVHEVKSQAKDIEVVLGLYMADALHLATAIYLRTPYFVVDDHHFLTPEVINYALGFTVQVVRLPALLASLNLEGVR